MVRSYKRVPGTRNYKNYTEDTLEEALSKITDGEISINAASLVNKIPFGTLYNRYKGLHGSTPGGQPIFTHIEEAAILRSAATCADWGFPLTTLDLRMFAKAYLDKKGRNVSSFTNNLPGIDWALSVLKRHKNSYGQRLATNIKRSRAAVGRESLNKYFDNLQREVNEVPPSNIFNYDESNLSDDPGKRKCIYRRGVKYPEKVRNHSKSCTTVMICGSADGTLLPPYVIYKAAHLYNTWKENGIVGNPCCTQPCCSLGSRYNRTDSGWIDAPTFRNWFMTSFLPHAVRLEGRKVLIGDNLSTHLDNDVLKLCETHNISFVCLVPNSTHLTQPLDVGFFRPMKGAWRSILENWKKCNPRAPSVPKESFPKLLKEAILEMDGKQQPHSVNRGEKSSACKRNLISSFVATGIYPINREIVLKKIPDDSPNAEATTENEVRDTLTNFLKEARFGKHVEPTRKKKRLQVEPGKSVSTLDEAGPSTTSNNDVIRLNENRQQDIELNQRNPTSENAPEDSDITDCESILGDRIIEDLDRGPQVGQFILAKFDSAKGKKTYQYVCMIEDIYEDKLVVLGYKSQKKKKTIFRAVERDVSIIEIKDVITYLPQPKFKDNCYIFQAEINIKEM